MITILVIEDDAKIRKNLARLLTLEDYDVLTAVNGLDGLEMALLNRPNLILCDILMPEMNGHEVLRVLKEKAPDYFAPFIFITAKGSKDDIRQGMNLGADDYLTKPFTRNELLDAVTSRLEKRQTVDQHLQEQLQKIAVEKDQKKYIDPITGLPNVLYLKDHFSMVVHEFESMRFNYPDRNILLPFFVLRFERSEQIRRNLSVNKYELLLKAIATRVEGYIGEPKQLVMLNDHEFAILVKPVQKRLDIKTMAEDVLQLFKDSFLVGEQEFFLRAKVGISLYGRDGYSASELIKKSLNAIESLGEQPTILYQFYSLTFSLGSKKKTFLESELHYAIEKQQIRVFYQPQIDLKTGQVSGFEALARWKHPEMGMVSPLDFIPIAEETGLIKDIGFFILETAVEDVRHWQKKYNVDFRLAVNFSSQQLRLPNICHDLVNILIDHDFNPEQLDVEITESILIKNFKQIITKLNALQRLGCKIAMDDFGTGYSSLNYVRLLPWDIIKIDRAFVSKIHENEVNKVITKGIIVTAHELGFKIVAEGIEDNNELAVLTQYDCDFIQGYFISKPISASLIEETILNAYPTTNPKGTNF